MKFKRFTVLILISALILGLAACGTGENKSPGPEIDSEKQNQQEQKNNSSDEEKQDEPREDASAQLSLSKDELPVIDGATAMLPYYEEMVARICGISAEEAESLVLCNTTAQAYPNLYEKKADLIFCAPPSEEQIESARVNGVEYESVQVLNSGFVFFVNKSNPVDNLSSQQLHDIYAGKITNWKEVGGKDEPIIAYQRSEGSGSQTGLYQHVISKDEAAEPLTEQKIGIMAEIIDAVANYDNASGAIGYSYYYYVTNMHYQEDVKLISIDNVYPNEETISYDIYPYISKTCAVFRSDEPEDSVVRKIAAWCSGSAGRQMSVDLGYVPSGNGKVIVSGYNDYVLHEPYYLYRLNNIDIEKISVTADSTYGYSYDISSYLKISGLKDEKAQQSINDAIKAVYDKYTDEGYTPSGKCLYGLKDKSGGTRTFNVYRQFNGNNILSMFFTFSYSKEEDGNYYNSTEYEGLTFDLNTGRLLKLGDLFEDSENGINYINSTLYDMINESNLYEEDTEDYLNSLRLVRPFNGLKDDQKFYIGADGYLWLIFDGNTPEFYVDYADSATLNFNVRNIVDFEKYIGKASPFVNEDETVYQFFCGETAESTSESDFTLWINEKIGDRNIYVMNYSGAYDGLTEKQQEAMSFDMDYVEGVLEETISIYDKETAEGSENVYGHLSFNSWISAAGNYTVVTKSFSSHIESEKKNEYISIPVVSETVHYNFRNGRDEALTFEEIFAEGTDIKAVLKTAIYKQLESSENNIDLAAGDLEGFIDDALNNIQDCSIELECINLNIPKLSEYFYSRFDGVENAELYDYSSAVSYVYYKNIGCSNLNIFMVK